MRAFLILLLCHLVTHLSSQTFNVRLSFEDESLETGKVCLELNDNYLFLAAYYDSIGVPRTGTITTNLIGQPIDTAVVFTDSTIYILGYYSGAESCNNGFITCGFYAYEPFDMAAGMLIKHDSYGDTLWTKTVQPVDDEGLYFSKAIQVSNGYVLCGSSVSAAGEGKGLLMKFDEEGNELWRKDYLPTSNESPIRLVSAVATPDGGFLLGGATMAAFNWNHLVIKTDSLGNQIWRKTEGDEFSNLFAMVANTADGKYVFAGQDKNAEQFHDRSQVTKLNNNGTIVWTHYFGEEGPDCWAASIKPMSDGGFVFCGSDRSFGGLYGYICRIDSEGNQLWYRKYRQTEGNWGWFTDVSPTSDNGFILTGLLQSDTNLNLPQDMWAIKLDSMGCLVPGCHLIDVAENEIAAMSIYPNPADDFINVYVETKQVTDCALHLFDLQGREISCTTVRENSNTWMMDCSSLAAGTYLLQLLVDGVAVKSEKVVVRH